MANQFRKISGKQLQKLFDDLIQTDAHLVKPSELQKSLRDIHVYHTELEKQNSELQDAKARLEESHEFYADLYDFAPVGYLTLSSEGHILRLNLTAATLLNANRIDLEGESLLTWLDPDHRQQFMTYLQSVFSASGKGNLVTELVLNNPQGSPVHVLLESIACYDPAAQAMAARTVMIDIRDQKQSDERLQHTKDELGLKVLQQTAELMDVNYLLEKEIDKRQQLDKRLRQAATVFDSTEEGIVITDSRYHIIAVNRAFTDITGYTEVEARGQHLQLLEYENEEKGIDQTLWTSLALSGRWQGEIRKRRKNGEIFVALESINVVKDNDKITNYVVVFADISAIKESQERLNFLAYHDPLTSLPNRLLFDAKLEHTLQRAKRHNQKFALLFLDLDRFKTINDTLGHKHGDLLLQEIAAALSASIRAEDTVARLGGDEFIILLDEVSHAEDVASLAEKIIARIAQPVMLAGHEMVISTSIGISVYPDDAENIDDLIKAADVAMYDAKTSGKQTYRFYSSDLTNRAFEHLAIEQDLRQALVKNEFELHYQPMVSLITGKVVGVEALLRWQHPEKGLMLPMSFIDVAEETGLICEIGGWVLREVCNQAKKWQSSGMPPLRIAINVSARQILYDDFVEKMRTAYQSAGLEPGDVNLELEITERVLQSESKSVDLLEALHDFGVRLCIDDFGIGYSSLSKLKSFPIDAIKIDRSFIQDIPGSQEGRAIVSAIIALAHSLKLDVVAEGVESSEQSEFLQAQGCINGQGYLFTEPLTASEIRQYIH